MPKVKNKILKTSRLQQFKCDGATFRITQDLVAETLKEYASWNTIYQKAKELRLWLKISCPAMLSTTLNEKKIDI